MSTNINDAFLTKTKPHEIIKRLVERRPYYMGVIRAEVITKIVSDAVVWYDIPDDKWEESINPEGVLSEIKDRNDFHDFISMAYKEMHRAEKDGEDFSHYLRLSIGVYPSTGGKTFVTVHGSYDLVAEFIKNESDWLGEDYSYWDSSDKPDELTTRQWNKRRDDWDKIFGYGSTRVESMFTYSYNEDVKSLSRSVYGLFSPLSDITPHVKLPTDEKRKRELVFNQEYVKVERGDDWELSDFMETRRKILGEIDNGVHDEAIAKITLKPLTTSKWINALINEQNK